MRKKYLSALLFGALLFASAGTFTSCKDYDDDIKNLQEQIDSQKTDLESKVTAMETTVSNLQSAQTSLESEIASVKSDAEAAALAAQNTAIETAKAELEAAKAELQAAIEAGASASEEAIAEAAAAAEKVMAEVSGRVDALESFQATTEEALKNLQAANETLLTNITTLETEVANQLKEQGQRLTALEAQVAALEEYKASDEVATKGNAAQIEQILKDLENLQAGELTDAMIDKISAQITEEISAELTLLSDALGKQVTHISLYATTYDAYGTTYKALNLTSAEAVRTWTFGEGLAGEPVSFKKGDKETFEDSFLLRVSPVNANLTLDNIKLVNSELKDLKGLVDIKSIEPYKELLTSRAVSENGLWKVTVKLVDNYDTDAYKEAASTYNEDGTKDKDILYAVMVGESLTGERQVVSEYGLTLSQEDQTPRRVLSYFVNDENVNNIKNRWDGAKPTVSENGGEVEYEELTWKYVTKTDPHGNVIDVYAPYAEPIWDASKPADEKNNVELADYNAKRGNDVRFYQAAYSVKAGQPFSVSLKEYAEDENYAKSIRAFYVTLDEQCAAESQPSEINAWKSYNIKGINTVTSESSIELTIPTDVNADGDYIGFRVYAVNYDGSLVDPDGKAFYVYVGETAQVGANVTVSMKNEIVVPLATTMNSNSDEFSTANWGRANSMNMAITDSEGNNVNLGINLNNVQFIDKDGKDIEQYENGRVNTKATSVKLINVPANALKDGMTYTMTITARNSDSGIVAVGTITFTKSLPAFPTDVYPFTGQLDANKNLKVYPYADGDDAVYNMQSSWHGLVDKDGVPYTNLSIYEVADPGKNTLSYVTADDVTADDVTDIVAPKSLVNPKDKAYGTKFPMNISYNYGEISYAFNDKTQDWETKEWKTYYGQFTMQIGNYVDDCKFATSGVKVNYPGAVGKEEKINMNSITVTDWYGAKIDLSKIKDQKDDTKEGKYFDVFDDSTPFKVQFLTGANYDRVDEYFTFAKFQTEAIKDNKGNVTGYNHFIIMTSKSDAATGSTVPTKIRLVFKDKFGNEITKDVEGTFDMQFQQ